MRLHQVLTGAANVFDDSVAVSHGNVFGFPFTVYGSGYEVVILDGHFNRIQIISRNDAQDTLIVKCISCSGHDGKIAVSFGRKVVLFEPESIAATDTKLPYQWKEVANLSFSSEACKLCWDRDGRRLLVGSDSLHLFRHEPVLCGSSDDLLKWTCVWKRKLSTPAKLLDFSPDGHYFASAGIKDCMVKIWFMAPKVNEHPTTPLSSHEIEEKYNFIYILHPAAVQSLSWRKTGKHMPLCSVPNVLLTSCADNVCRIWAETVKYRPSCYHENKSAVIAGQEMPLNKHIGLDSNSNREDRHQQLHQRYHLVSMFHFHLAAVINPSSDIALLSAIPTSSIFGRSFQLQWLNNKEIQLTTAVELIYASLKKNSPCDTSNESDPFLLVDEVDGEIEYNASSDEAEKILDQTLDEDEMIENMEETEPKDFLDPPTNLNQTGVWCGESATYKSHLNDLLHDWRTSSDTLYCIHPADGSLLIWVVDNLDDFTSAYYRQVQVSFASRIPATFSKADASSLCWTGTHHYTKPVHKIMQHGVRSLFGRQRSPRQSNNKYLLSQNNFIKNEQLSVLQVSYLVSAHADGSLNLWVVTFSDTGTFTGIASITHVTRSCGPRFETTQLVSHPILPLVIGTSQQTKDVACQRSEPVVVERQPNISDIKSELILWHTSHVSPLTVFKGVTEMARISSANPTDFLSISWVPALYQHSLLSITCDSVELIPDTPCSCFVSASGNGLQLYQILLDAKSLLSHLSMQRITPVPNSSQNLADFIDSEQSGSHSACIMKLCTLECSEQLSNIEFLHIYNGKSLLSANGNAYNSNYLDEGAFYVVAINREGKELRLHVWSVNVAFDGKFDVQSLGSPDSVYSDHSATTPKALVVSHCLKQKYSYNKVLLNNIQKDIRFASAADNHCSRNLNSSCPPQYNFLGAWSDGTVQFWNITLGGSDVIVVHEMSEIQLSLNDSVLSEVLCIACAGTSRFACVTKHVASDDGKVCYELFIKENESSGEIMWNTQGKISIAANANNDSQKVEVSWLSLGNGSYLLAVALQNTAYIFSPNRVVSEHHTVTCNWEIIKEIKMANDQGLHRLTTISWTNGGFFLIGVENEIQVFSQWEDDEKHFRFKNQVSVAPKSEDENSEHGIIITRNSFTIACEYMKNLPQYHPKHLMELLNLGKLRRVRTILRHLVRCVAGIEAADAAAELGDIVEPPRRPRAATRTFSNLSDYSASPGSEIILDPPVDNTTLDLDIVTPLTLTTLARADHDESAKIGMDLEKGESETGMAKSAVYYGLAQANLLTEQLSKKQLPGLTSQEQMYLLALSDTIASTRFEFGSIDANDLKFKYGRQDTIDSTLSNLSQGGGGYATTGATGVGSFGSDTVDDCGLRFLLLMRHHTALTKSLSQRQKAFLKKQCMSSAEYCWAFHSDCKEELLAMIPGMSKGEPTWPELKVHGAGWWLRSNDLLRRTIEKVAKAHFQMKKEPLDCAIFYLAMKKKTLLCALYRSLQDAKMSTFFSNDFNQDRWRKAALKNAYALLGKQRFEHAAAFFLLGGALWDAVQVCITRLNDIQLALVIARLYEGNNDTHTKILEKHVFGYDREPRSDDPFHCSMAHWITKDYGQSLNALLVSVNDDNKKIDFNYPAIFNFYQYLRTHPVVRRRHLTQHKAANAILRTYSIPENVSDFDDTEKHRLCERRLCFLTASTHLNAGLPSIALEVLLLLSSEHHTELIDDKQDLNQSETVHTEQMIITGTISGDFINNDKSDNTPSISTGVFGWDSSSTNQFADLEDEYKIGISLDDSDEESDQEEKSDISVETGNEQTAAETVEEGVQEKKISSEDKTDDIDIVSLNLRYTCVIRCILEELKVLAVKCNHDHMKLRASLCGLLEQDFQFLHQICDYKTGSGATEMRQPSSSFIQRQVEEIKDARSALSISSISLYDGEESSLRKKVEQVAMHSEWLKQNHQILTSLYEHCLMVGTGDPEIPAVCLELLFLLHEIEGHRVLSSPLASISAGPSAPPLLLSSMASFSLVASPTAFLQSMAHDLLQTVIDLPSLPTPQNPVTRLADLESLMCSLSSCVYHSLCGGDDDRLLASIKNGEVQLCGKQMKNGKLYRLPYGSIDVDLEATSPAAQWPGVKFFASLLTASNKDGSRSLKLLLCEAAVAVYLSMLVSASSRLACNNLYRLISNGLSEDMWASVFGGGTKIVVPAPENQSVHRTSPKQERKHDTARMRWNYKLLGTRGQPTQNQQDDSKKFVRHELFVPPTISLSDYFMTKKENTKSLFVYNSEDEESDDENEEEYHLDSADEDDGFIDEAVIRKHEEEKRRKLTKLNEHYDCSSYPWLIMQLALVKIVTLNINSFVSTVGLDLSDLPTQSPLLYNATKILLRWEQLLLARLETYPTLEESLFTYTVSLNDDGVARGGIALQRLKLLLDPENTPFSTSKKKSKPAKRLWNLLVQQEPLRQLFLHYAFKSTPCRGNNETDYEIISGHILHKDPEPITSFCLNKSNFNYVAVSTTHEVIEYDITGSLDADDAEFLDEQLPSVDLDESDTKSAKKSAPTIIQRRPCFGVRRMDSHPSLPYYVTGGNDGSVRMFEFIHPDQIVQFRGPGQNERVNKVLFNPLGNKFGVVDDSGFLSMWLVANTSDTAPYLTLKCHNKGCLDFVYVGSSSLIATVGNTSDKRNICLWDTLLPPKKALVHSFTHNAYGAQSLTYVPGMQCLIAGGKRGDICIFDIRQRRLLHTFQAHVSLVNTITLDPSEKFFVTGSSDGDIKVWELDVHDLLESFPKEHAKGTVSLRQIRPGVQCLNVLVSGQLFSCGGDGILKWRSLQSNRRMKAS